MNRLDVDKTYFKRPMGYQIYEIFDTVHTGRYRLQDFYESERTFPSFYIIGFVKATLYRRIRTFETNTRFMA